MKRYDPEITYMPYHPEPQVEMEELSDGEYVTYEDAKALEDEVTKLKAVLSHTRELICEGVLEGFNPLAGDWAERLFLNNANIAEVLD